MAKKKTVNRLRILVRLSVAIRRCKSTQKGKRRGGKTWREGGVKCGLLGTRREQIRREVVGEKR